MALELSGLVNLVIEGLSAYTFGNHFITTTIIILFFLVFALLIRIPLPFALTIPLPLVIVFVAYGYLPLAIGVLFAVGFLVLAGLSFVFGLGVK